MSTAMTISQQIDLLVDSMVSIPTNKNYWLIRTQAGTLYDEFRSNDFVALEHFEVPLLFLNQIKDLSSDQKNENIKRYVKDYYQKKVAVSPTEELTQHKTSLIASQIYRFVYELKKGDTVIIPSSNSDYISFGVVTESFIAGANADLNSTILNQYTLKKRVRWIKEIARKDVEPYLFRIFTAHQAINDIGQYADIIERSVKDLYVLDDEAHLVINVGADNISATNLFGLGCDILGLIDAVAKEFGLDVKSSDLEVAININSPGKIDLKSKIRKTTIIAGIILFICGGGYEGHNGTKISTPGLPAIVETIFNFIKTNKESALKEKIFEQYKDSLQVKQPEDMILLLKQVSDNKDLPK